MSLIDDLSQQGAVCRTFVRSQYSPRPEQFERTQRDYDTVCGWFKDIAAKLPRNVDPGTGEIDLGKLSPEPQVVEGDLNEGDMVITGQTTAGSKTQTPQASTPGFGGAPRTPGGGGRGR